MPACATHCHCHPPPVPPPPAPHPPLPPHPQHERAARQEVDGQARKAREEAHAAQLALATDKGAFAEQRRAAETQIQQLKVCLSSRVLSEGLTPDDLGASAAACVTAADVNGAMQGPYFREEPGG